MKISIAEYKSADISSVHAYVFHENAKKEAAQYLLKCKNDLVAEGMYKEQDVQISMHISYDEKAKLETVIYSLESVDPDSKEIEFLLEEVIVTELRLEDSKQFFDAFVPFKIEEW